MDQINQATPCYVQMCLAGLFLASMSPSGVHKVEHNYYAV